MLTSPPKRVVTSFFTTATLAPFKPRTQTFYPPFFYFLSATRTNYTISLPKVPSCITCSSPALLLRSSHTYTCIRVQINLHINFILIPDTSEGFSADKWRSPRLRRSASFEYRVRNLRAPWNLKPSERLRGVPRIQ